jgi:hypothetical protein
LLEDSTHFFGRLLAGDASSKAARDVTNDTSKKASNTTAEYSTRFDVFAFRSTSVFQTFNPSAAIPFAFGAMTCRVGTTLFSTGINIIDRIIVDELISFAHWIKLGPSPGCWVVVALAVVVEPVGDVAFAFVAAGHAVAALVAEGVGDRLGPSLLKSSPYGPWRKVRSTLSPRSL